MCLASVRLPRARVRQSARSVIQRGKYCVGASASVRLAGRRALRGARHNCHHPDLGVREAPSDDVTALFFFLVTRAAVGASRGVPYAAPFGGGAPKIDGGYLAC